MITDNQTNFLYLSEKLLERKKFAENLTSILTNHQIPYDFLPSTKDIWAVDYMPIQVESDKFIRFTYEPDYLNYKKYQSTKTNADEVCEQIKIPVTKSKIILDGGNVIKGKDWVILTDKIFKENLERKPNELLKELEGLLECRVIIIPAAPLDYTGHADGILRFYDDRTVLINEYPFMYQYEFQTNLQIALHNAGLESIEIPYNPFENQSNNEAHGLYINFLQMDKFLLVPVFHFDEDDRAVYQFEKLFPNHIVKTIDATEISKDGGVLNCISWNILK